MLWPAFDALGGEREKLKDEKNDTIASAIYTLLHPQE